jgi:UDP-N-acetylglucosamine 3-dehydrogenase
MTETMRVAIIGLGSMGRNHLRVLSSINNVEVAAVSDVDPQRLVAGPWATHTDYRNLRLDVIDYVVVATPTPTHLEICRHFLEHGVPLLVEKPAASTSSEVAQLIAVRNANEANVAVGMIERFNGVAQEAKRLVGTGSMGRLLKISTRRVGPPPGREMGVGVLKDLAVHDLDLILWMTGLQINDLQMRSISDVVSCHDDLALIVGQLDGGVLTTTEVSWLSPIKRREIELLFSNGSAVLDLISGEVAIAELAEGAIEWDVVREFVGSGRSNKRVFSVKNVEPLVREHQAVLNAVRTGTWADVPSLDESFHLLNLIERTS